MKLVSKILVLCLVFSHSVVLAESVETESQSQKIANTRAILEHNKQNQGELIDDKGTKNAWGSVEEVSVLNSGGNVMKGLMLCIGLLLLGAGLLKKLKGKTTNVNNKRIQVIEKQTISPKSSLLLVDVDGQSYLVSTGSEQVSFCNIPKCNSFKQKVETYKEVQCIEQKKLAV